MRLARALSAKIGYDWGSLEKGRKFVGTERSSLDPLFMLDCDGHRHAEPVLNSYDLK